MTSVQDSFTAIGSRARMTKLPARSWGRFEVNVLRDDRGEYFDFVVDRATSLVVLDVAPADRHLVVQASSSHDAYRATRPPATYLCGHDERAWFVAAIPEDAGAETVRAAKDALKPAEVWDAIREFDVPADEWDERSTAAFVRQGEWFFLPRYDLRVDEQRVLHDEPISRGSRSKPHACECLFRIDGVEVFTCEAFPNGLTERQVRGLRDVAEHRWERRVRDAKVFVRGRVTHPDHAPIRLSVWHEVVMNTETRAAAMANVAFFD